MIEGSRLGPSAEGNWDGKRVVDGCNGDRDGGMLGAQDGSVGNCEGCDVGSSEGCSDMYS